MTDSRQLLADYADNGSEAAFRELVNRYIDLVYSTARRMLNGDAHLAEDVTQTVFADLARKAPTFSKAILVGGWLHRHTCYLAANVLRRERRRQAREQETARMNAPEYDPNDATAQLAPVLDEAIDELSAPDRAAILLRFFEQHDLRAVGNALGSSEDAAQKRVSRALEKLRVILVRRGVALPGATLATALAAQAVTAAPTGLAASVSTAAVAGAATPFTLVNMMTMTKLKGAVLGALLVGAGATIILQHQSKAKLRDENLALLQKYEQFTGLQAENARLSNLLVNARQAASMSRDQLSELMRLRGEVALARNQKTELDNAREENRPSRSAGALALIGSTALVAAAEITGKVVLKGTPPPEITIDMSTSPDKFCGAAHTTPETTRHYVVGKDGGLANVLVYIKSGLEGKSFPAPTSEPMLDQVGCIYEPYVMGVQVNQKLKIKNSDPTMHNVHATPKINKEFNFAQPIKDQVTERSFDKTEVPIRFMCNVHPWMFAYVGVFDHPFFAVTDKDGNFKISGLPNGKYTLEAYHVKTHRDAPGVSKEADVSGNTKVDFTIELK